MQLSALCVSSVGFFFVCLSVYKCLVLIVFLLTIGKLIPDFLLQNSLTILNGHMSGLAPYGFSRVTRTLFLYSFKFTCIDVIIECKIKIVVDVVVVVVEHCCQLVQ